MFEGLSDGVPKFGLAKFLDSSRSWVEGVEACVGWNDGLDVDILSGHLLDDRLVCGYTDEDQWALICGMTGSKKEKNDGKCLSQ